MKNFIILLVVLVALLFVSQAYSIRWDATSNQRYSFSNKSKDIISQINSPISIDVYLTGDLTGDFRLLQNEVTFYLDELVSNNPNFKYQLINALEEDLNLDSLASIGVQDIAVPTEDKILRVFPFSTLNYKGKVKTVPLLVKTKIPIEERAIASINSIEKSFIDKIKILSVIDKKTLGLLVHHNELPPMYLDGFLKNASQLYDIIPLTEPVIDSSYSFNVNSIKTLDSIDALVIAKPVKAFSDEDKLTLDQYVMNGGKTLWFTESVDAEMDSLFRSDKIVTFPRDLNLNDLFFSYGVRIVPSIVKDLQSGFITLAIGEIGNNTAYEQFPWTYFPVSIPNRNHPITSNVSNPVKFEFANPIELLPRKGLNTTVLLNSSNRWQLQEPLSFVQFNEIENINSENYYPKETVLPLAVLLEGTFQSAYSGRLESKTFEDFKDESIPNKMIIVSDGDFIKNQVFKGETLPLGADKYTMRPDVPKAASTIYGNLDFVMNSLEYLLHDDFNEEMNEATQKIYVLDDNKINENKDFLRWLNFAFPLLFIWIVGILLMYRRKRKYS